TLAMSAANAAYGGIITINGGVIRVTDPLALGTTGANTVVANNVGSALQVSGGINLAEPLSLSSTGINNAGALVGMIGTNTVSGAITIANAANIGADSGAILNIS